MVKEIAAAVLVVILVVRAVVVAADLLRSATAAMTLTNTPMNFRIKHLHRSPEDATATRKARIAAALLAVPLLRLNDGTVTMTKMDVLVLLRSAAAAATAMTKFPMNFRIKHLHRSLKLIVEEEVQRFTHLQTVVAAVEALHRSRTSATMMENLVVDSRVKKMERTLHRSVDSTSKASKVPL